MNMNHQLVLILVIELTKIKCGNIKPMLLSYRVYTSVFPLSVIIKQFDLFPCYLKNNSNDSNPLCAVH